MGHGVSEYYQFLSGAVMMGCFAAAVFFLRFWHRTRDRLFLIFASSFFTLMIERMVLAILRDQAREERSLVYLIRLIAFLMILVGIWDKNFTEKKRR